MGVGGGTAFMRASSWRLRVLMFPAAAGASSSPMSGTGASAGAAGLLDAPRTRDCASMGEFETDAAAGAEADVGTDAGAGVAEVEAAMAGPVGAALGWG